ncbi:VOC family protein [Rhodococcus sp. NPDC058505]|uniref:VOC family protein n=1 Tax=unclassified Rhodococcus (in: high G+C Gram-positive bacteria) TaxID=192944 RepID=UPI003651150F
MPQRQSQVGSPCWVDLFTSDPASAVPFYSGLFGWSCDTNEDPQYGGYAIFSKDGEPVAGMMKQGPDDPYGDVWTVYLEATDAAATVDRAAAAGAQVMMPAMQVGDQGTMAVLADPAGAVIGVWQPDRHRGYGRWGEPGTPAWFETMSRDYRAALPFYESVFGWTMTSIGDTDEFRYSQATVAGDEIAGVMDASGFLPEGVPSFWRYYLAVDDTDAALARVVELGGTVTAPAEDSPFGRVASVADPLGAQFQIVQPPRE